MYDNFDNEYDFLREHTMDMILLIQNCNMDKINLLIIFATRFYIHS